MFLQHVPVVTFDHNQAQDTNTEMEIYNVGEAPSTVHISVYVLVYST